MSYNSFMNKHLKELLKKTTLLIVDDDSKLRSIFKKTLNSYVKEIYEASNGNDALEIYHKYKPNIVFTDIKMPLMDGVMFITILRQLDIKIPIVAISGYSDSNDLINLASANLTDYLVKPVDFESLKTILSKCASQVEQRGVLSSKLTNDTMYVFSRKVLQIEEKDIILTPNEISLIELFIEHENKLVTINQIEDTVYNAEHVSVNAINTLVSKLRKKIGENIIRAIPSFGYIMVRKA